MKFVEFIIRSEECNPLYMTNTSGENGSLAFPDAEVCRLRYQTGVVNLVVLAVNDIHKIS